jgi:hypothetical protein
MARRKECAGPLIPESPVDVLAIVRDHVERSVCLPGLRVSVRQERVEGCLPCLGMEARSRCQHAVQVKEARVNGGREDRRRTGYRHTMRLLQRESLTSAVAEPGV